MVQIGFAVLWTTAIFLVSVAAAAKGRWPEQTGAAAAMFAWLASLFIVQRFQLWSGPHLALMTVDSLLLITLLGIGLYTARVWPLVACGFQLCGVGLDCAYLLKPSVFSGAYYLGVQITSWAVLITIGVGVGTAWRLRSASQANQ